MRAAMGILALLCVLFGIFPTTVIGVLDAVPQMLIGHGPPSLTTQGWLWLTPVSPRVASYSAPLVFAAIIIIGALTFLFLHARRRQMRRGYPWDCGFGNLNSRMQYTGTAFSMPIQRIFAPVWDLKEDIEETRDPNQPLRTEAIRHQLQANDRSWSRVYEPIGRLVLAAARRVGYIQTGSIHTYLGYSFFTLLLLLWLVTLVNAWLLAALQTLLFVAAAPLLAGWVKRVKCHLQNRAAPSVFQPYRDLAKLLRKHTVVAERASWLFRAAPYIVFGTAILAAACVPLIALKLPTAAIADVIVLVGFLALGRFFLALARHGHRHRLRWHGFIARNDDWRPRRASDAHGGVHAVDDGEHDQPVRGRGLYAGERCRITTVVHLRDAGPDDGRGCGNRPRAGG